MSRKSQAKRMRFNARMKRERALAGRLRGDPWRRVFTGMVYSLSMTHDDGSVVTFGSGLVR